MIQNRNEAGQQLAEKISKTITDSNLIVLAIPRGGVVVGNEIAKRLGCLLDIVISKKITPPDFPEYGIGAITHEGTIYEGPDWKNFCDVPNFEKELNKKKLEVKRRVEQYRGDDKYQLDNKIIILVDDGIATGSTIFALLKWLSKINVQKIILAVPVIPARVYEEFRQLVDKIYALEIPVEFSAVGQFYRDFEQVTDQEVVEILEKNKMKK